MKMEWRGCYEGHFPCPYLRLIWVGVLALDREHVWPSKWHLHDEQASCHATDRCRRPRHASSGYVAIAMEESLFIAEQTD